MLIRLCTKKKSPVWSDFLDAYKILNFNDNIRIYEEIPTALIDSWLAYVQKKSPVVM